MGIAPLSWREMNVEEEVRGCIPPWMAATLSAASLACRAVVGLEIHVQMDTRSKLFSAAPTTVAAPPNGATAPLDLGHPGVLPILNRHAVMLGVRAGLLLGCRIPPFSQFCRKHYYADMPAGYQITQQDRPVPVDGLFRFAVFDDPLPAAVHRVQQKSRVLMYDKEISISRVHLEQDSGKSIHDGSQSLIDFNRSGTALIEIVTGPDFGWLPEGDAESVGLEAACFVRQLRLLLQHHAICLGEVHKGHLRVDANVSLTEEDGSLGQRTEIKNINSIARVHSAINFEVRRQREMRAEGEEVVFETRTVDLKGNTMPMREKERIDYRFLFEPNLPRVTVPCEIRVKVQNDMAAKRALHERLIEECGFLPRIAVHLSEELELAEFMRRCWRETSEEEDGRAALKEIGAERFLEWLSTLQQITRKQKDVSFPPENPGFARHFVRLLRLVASGRLTRLSAIDLLKTLTEEDCNGKVDALIDSRNQWQIVDPAEIDRLAATVILGENEATVSKAEEGSRKSIQKLRNALLYAAEKRIDVEEATAAIERELARRN